MNTPGLLLFLLAGLAAGTAVSEGQEAPAIRFWAYDGDAPIRDLSGLPVFAARLGRLELLGRTDAAGELKVPKHTLRQQGTSVLLICRDESGTTCAAVRLDNDFVLGFDEYHLRIPPPEMIDRMTVEPKREKMSN